MQYLTSLLQLSIVLAGYPLYFASFEDVGESRIGSAVEPFEEVDGQVTEWLTKCWADTFIIIKDMNPVDVSDLYRFRRFAQQSRTTGSFLTDYPIQLRELADDLSIHCKAPLKSIDIYASIPTEQELNQRRTFYIEYDSSDRVDKSDVLEKVLSKLTSPYVTIIYSSSFGLDNPMFSSIEPDPKRDLWTQKYSDLLVERYKEPVIAPIIDEKKRDRIRGHRAQKPTGGLTAKQIREYGDYLPDDVFALVFIVGTALMAMMLINNGISSLYKSSKKPVKSVKKAKEENVTSDRATAKSTAKTSGSKNDRTGTSQLKTRKV